MTTVNDCSAAQDYNSQTAYRRDNRLFSKNNQRAIQSNAAARSAILIVLKHHYSPLSNDIMIVAVDGMGRVNDDDYDSI